MTRIARTVADCLRHLGTILPAPATRDARRARQPIADFVECVPDTVGSWFTRNILPKGEPLLRLRFFLEDVGYTLEEHAKLPEPFYHLGEMIAYGALTVDQAKTELDFQSSDVQSVYRLVLQGQNFSTSGERLRKLEELWAANKLAVEAARARHKDKVANLRLGVERSSGSSARTDREAPAPPPAQIADRRDARAEEATTPLPPRRTGTSVIHVLAPLTVAMAELCEQALELPVSERRRLHEAVGRETFSRLARSFERLSTEE